MTAPSIDRRSLLALGAGAALAPAFARGAMAQQSWPTQTVRVVVTVSAGSMTDIIARSLADKLRERWGQSVVVENRTGIGGAGSILRGTPDGHTLLFASNGMTVMRAVSRDIDFDPVTDFVPISPAATMPCILIVPGNGPHRTLRELVEAVRARPGAFNYASAGLGTTTGIVGELFRTTAGLQIQLLPFRGQPEANLATVRGDVAYCFTVLGTVGDLVQTGQLRALAVTGPARLPQLPDVPTFAEAGMPELVYDAWFGMFAPKGTPQAAVDRTAADIAEIVKMQDMIQRFAVHGVVLRAAPPATFAAMVRSDADRYGPIVSR